MKLLVMLILALRIFAFLIASNFSAWSLQKQHYRCKSKKKLINKSLGQAISSQPPQSNNSKVPKKVKLVRVIGKIISMREKIHRHSE